jgi:hypothetical protein
MKIVQSALLALMFFGPAVISSSAQAQSFDCFATQNETEEAACALLGTARLAFNALNNLDSNTDVQNARRYTRSIISGSYALGELLYSSASDTAVLSQLDRLKTLVLQLDATKRKLESRYPNNDELSTRLNRVRTTYYYLEGLLLPVEE